METELWVRALFALALVLALLGGFAVFMRWLSPRLGFASAGFQTGTKARLSVTAQALLDTRHRAVILKCDGVEHLVILGGANPVIVAQNLSPEEKK